MFALVGGTMKNRRGLIRNGTVLILITVVVTGIMIDINFNTKKMLSDSIHQTLNAVTEQQSGSFQQAVAADIRTVKNIALMLSPAYDDEQALLLRNLASNTNLIALVLADAQGHGVDYEGKPLDFTDSDVYCRAMQGESVIGSSAEVLFEEDPVIPIAIPVYDGQDMPQGVLIGGYPIEKLYELIPPSFGGEGKSYLVNGSGELLIAEQVLGLNSVDDFFFADFMNRMKTLDGSDKQQILSDLSEGQPGHMIFELDGSRWHSHYNPAGIGDWYVFTILHYDVGSAYASVISSRLAAAGIIMLICFLFCMVYIIYEQRKHTAELEWAAFYDDLCGCPNLAKFKYNAQEFIDRHPDDKMVMVKFDIGEFRLFNETLGNQMGNQILICVVDALRQVAPPGCYCRAHDDEFFALFMCDKPEEISQIHKNIQQQFYADMGSGFAYQLRLVVGQYYMFFENCKSASDGVEKASIAHRKAKEFGRDVCVYDEAFVRQALWKKQVKDQLDDAISKDEFLVYMQAQYTLSDETVSSAEALVRWKHAEKGLLAPGEFIPILEENDLIMRLDLYVWDKVCKILRGWIDAGVPPIEIAVNFSRKHLANPNFVKELCEIADQYQVPHHFLAVELTESSLWENEKVLLEMTELLHEYGFLLSIDDFGTGYSSLSLLKNLPVDILKIDRSFFTNNRYKTRAKQLISSVMKMAEELGMITIAEGIEYQEHVDFLREVGCNKIQGFFYERPVPSESFWMRKATTGQHEHPMAQPIIQPVGDIVAGRGELGEEMPVAVYRLFQLSMRGVLKQRYGEGEMIETIRSCGYFAGCSFANESLDLSAPVEAFLEELKEALLARKIGFLEIEKVSENQMEIIFTIKNDLECSGMENQNTTFCQYDEGFIAGVLYEYTKKTYSVIETDCWGNGADACRFLAKMC